MSKFFFKKRNRIRQLENQNWGFRQQLERQNFSFQLTVPVITTERGIEEVRFSGSPEAIEQLQKYLDIKGKKRVVRAATKPKKQAKRKRVSPSDPKRKANT